jgi:hypothetical protein
VADLDIAVGSVVEIAAAEAAQSQEVEGDYGRGSTQRDS